LINPPLATCVMMRREREREREIELVLYKWKEAFRSFPLR